MGVSAPTFPNGPPLEGAPITYRSDTGRVFKGFVTADGLVTIAGVLMVHMRVPDLLLNHWGDPVVIVAPVEACEWRKP